MTTLQLFDTRNTCTTTSAVGVKGARKYAKRFTANGKYHHVVVRNGSDYEEYQNGDIVAWSYPHGCSPTTHDLAKYGY